MCPECGGPVVHDSGCEHCPLCGWSKCETVRAESV